MSNLKKQEFIESFFTDSILNILENQKLQNISVFKGNSDSSHQKVIIGTSTSNTQMNGVVNKINKFINEKSNLNIEGRNSTWLLIEIKDKGEFQNKKIIIAEALLDSVIQDCKIKDFKNLK